MYNVDGPNIAPNEVVNIVPGEGQIPVSFTSEPNCGTLACPKDYYTGRNHFNEEREIAITPSKYVHTRQNVMMIDLLLILNIYFMH